MKHPFSASTQPDTDANICVTCGYDIKSHGSKAICEECGLENTCDFFPDIKHSRRMLICEPCKQGIYAQAKKMTEERKATLEAHEVIKTANDFFNADTPSILRMKEAIEADDSIENKPAALAKAVLERQTWVKKRLLETEQEIRELRGEQNSNQIFLNHLAKQLSEEKQKELGITDITYKPKTEKVKSPKAITTKKINKDEIRKYEAQFNIPPGSLNIIMLARKNVTVEQAAKIWIEVNAKEG